MTVRTGAVEVVEEAPRPEPEGGLGALRTERGNLPLETVEVRAAVAGLAVRTEVAQGFRNPYDEPLEATYIFPLPDRAAVTRLRMEAADRVVEGVVKEREAARADYDQAISEGRRASIAEEERPGVFTLRVGNIMPGERVVVRTTLSGRLPYEDGQATFRFPLVVAPRYIPGEALAGGAVGDGTAADTDQVPDASRISPPVLLPGFPDPVRLSIEVAVDPAGLPLTGLTSGLHGVSVAEEQSGRHMVRLDPGARCDRDFVLRLGYGGQAAATSLAAARDHGGSSGAEGTFLLTVLPPEPTGAVRPRDVVLVLDRSGSMGGWKMTAARRAAARIVDTLTAADRFAVLTFDHHITTPPDLPGDALSPATDRNRFRAVQHLATVESRGGTEMARPLRFAADLLTGTGTGSDAAAPAAEDRDKVLVLVTDGQVGNEDALLSDLAASLAGLRVHTVGVDTAVNAGFLNRLAALGGGRCELVESEDRLDEAMDAIHRRIGTPLVTGITLAGTDGLRPDQGSITPARLPDLFAGAPLVVAGRYTADDGSGAPGTAGAEHALTVTGTAADGSVWTRRVAAVAAEDADLAPFWARGRIRDLEDRYASGYQGQDELEKAIIDTSVRFSVLSRFTAFVAVDTEVANEGGTVKRVTQPVDLPAGWETGAAQAGYVPFSGGYGGPVAASAPAMSHRSRSLDDGLALDVYSVKSAKIARGVPPGPRPITPAPVPPPPGSIAPPPMPRPGSGPVPTSAPGSRPRSGPAPTPITDEIFASIAAEPQKKATRADLPPLVLSPDELDQFAESWLTRLDGADPAAELLQLLAELRLLTPRFPATQAVALNALISALEAEDTDADERRTAAVTFLKTLRKPQRRAFWKR